MWNSEYSGHQPIAALSSSPTPPTPATTPIQSAALNAINTRMIPIDQRAKRSAPHSFTDTATPPVRVRDSLEAGSMPLHRLLRDAYESTDFTLRISLHSSRTSGPVHA